MDLLLTITVLGTNVDLSHVADRVLGWLSSNGLRILLILILAGIGLKVGRLAVDRIFNRFVRGEGIEAEKRADTLASVMKYVVSIGLLALILVMILGEFGVKIGPILAAAGVLGLAVGFGAQHLVQDVFSGFFILLEDQIRVGDVVTISGHTGLVEKVNLRMTILRDLSGNVHYIRNGMIDVVTNMTKDYSRYVFEIGVAYREDVDEVITVMKQVDAEMREDEKIGGEILEDLEIMGLDAFADSSIVIKARTKTKPSSQWKIKREYLRRLKKRFDELDIEIPFPHITLYMGQDKDGSAPPLHAMLEGNGSRRAENSTPEDNSKNNRSE